MTASVQPRLAVSTWSLHRTLGRLPPYGPETEQPPAPPVTAAGVVSLLDLPARLASFGIHKLEICHFHLPSRDTSYLKQLRTALENAEVELWQLLIDGGDVTHPQHGERDLAWIQGWLDVAGQLGATRARVIAGKAEPSQASLETSRHALARLADYANARHVRLTTENWHNLLSKPEHVFTLLDGLDGAVGLLADFGNWRGPTKYADLAQILPRAETSHAKCHFSAPGIMDREDYVQCLELAKAAHFAGPYSLIYDGPGDDEWAGLQMERAVVAGYLN